MQTLLTPDVRPGRLSALEYATRFAEATPRFTQAQAVLEAERCLYCYDAPCATACPTSIDVPSFIKRIADGTFAARPPRFWTATRWAACAHGSARQRTCAKPSA